ncbi:MAG: sulfotransferase [Caulobacter sp.]|nr:sulfotransferase [Caulobacter sp.]
MTAQDAERWHQAGAAASARGDVPAAIKAFEQAATADPSNAGRRARLAVERLRFGDIPGARQAVAEGRAIGGSPDAKTLDRFGFVLSRTGDFSEAVALFRQAAALAPRDVAILKNLGWGEQYVGDLAAAEAALRRVLTLAPEDDKAWFSLSGLPGWSPTLADAAALDRLLGAVAGDAERSLGVGHALARAQEALGDYPAALKALDRAKAPRRRQRAFDIDATLAAFEAAPKAFAEGPTGPGHPSAAPIFVVGPPRSGTTLLDRILSSHPAITSAGELRAMPLLALRAAGIGAERPITADILMRGARAPAAPLGAAYVEAAAAMSGGGGRYIDKRPFNLIFAGFIARVLPNARILRMRRNPADTVLGNYRQFFGSGSLFHDYSYDLVHTARYVAGLEALSEAWEALLPPDRYRVIDYEALVAEPEREIRQALAFLGLDWDPRCLDFHRNEAGVSTASAVQVREPLHDRNIGLWRRYGEGFGPAMDILRAASRLE